MINDKETCNNIEITRGRLIPETMHYQIEGYRLVQICCVTLGDTFKLSYSFAKGYDMDVLQLTVPKETRIPSISNVFECAFLYENEMTELFDVNINMISTDYHGKLYRIEKEAPFKEKGDK